MDTAAEALNIDGQRLAQVIAAKLGRTSAGASAEGGVLCSFLKVLAFNISRRNSTTKKSQPQSRLTHSTGSPKLPRPLTISRRVVSPEISTTNWRVEFVAASDVKSPTFKHVFEEWKKSLGLDRRIRSEKYTEGNIRKIEIWAGGGGGGDSNGASITQRRHQRSNAAERENGAQSDIPPTSAIRP